MKKIAILIPLFLLLSVLSSIAGKQPTVGQKMPNLSKLLPDTKVPNTKGKVVMIDFWASWCGPCRASFPSFSRLQRKYASKGLVIIAIGVDEDVKKYKAFAAKYKAPFLLAHDASHKAAGFFNPPTMPTSYLIDRKGVIRHIHKGFKGKKTEAAYDQEIRALLAQ